MYSGLKFNFFRIQICIISPAKIRKSIVRFANCGCFWSGFPPTKFKHLCWGIKGVAEENVLHIVTHSHYMCQSYE